MPGTYIREGDSSYRRGSWRAGANAPFVEVTPQTPPGPPEPTPGSWSGWGGEITTLPYTYTVTLSLE